MSDRWLPLLGMVGLVIGAVIVLMGGDKVGRYDNLRLVKDRKIRSALVQGRRYYMIVFLVLLLFFIVGLLTGRLKM